MFRWYHGDSNTTIMEIVTPPRWMTVLRAEENSNCYIFTFCPSIIRHCLPKDMFFRNKSFLLIRIQKQIGNNVIFVWEGISYPQKCFLALRVFYQLEFGNVFSIDWKPSCCMKCQIVIFLLVSMIPMSLYFDKLLVAQGFYISQIQLIFAVFTRLL